MKKRQVSKLLILSMILSLWLPLVGERDIYAEGASSITWESEGIVMDNETEGYSEGGNGIFRSSTNSALFPTRVGANHRYSSTVGDWARWTPDFSSEGGIGAGVYKVYFNKMIHTSNDSEANVTVLHNGETTSRTVDLSVGEHGYEFIGIFEFSAGGDEYIEVSKTRSGGHIRADSVKFVPAPFLPDLNDSDVTTSSITLNWNEAAWATGYKLYRSQDTAGHKMVVYEGGERTFTDTGLAGDTAYDYWISAYDSEGESQLFGPVHAVTNVPPTLAIIGDDFISSEGTVTVSTSIYALDPVDVLGKTVTFQVEGNGELVSVSPEYIVTGDDFSRQAGDYYYYDIPITFQLLNDGIGGGMIDYTIEMRVDDQTVVRNYTALNSPDSPANLAPAVTSASSIQLVWEKAVSATEYHVFRSEQIDGSYIFIGQTSDINYVDQAEEVISGETYYYKVSAVNEAGESVKSNAVSATARNSLAHDRPVATSNEYELTRGTSAVDGNPDTMWRNFSADGNEFVWLMVDLVEQQTIDSVILQTFKSNEMTDYRIQVSNDRLNWTDVYVQDTPPVNQLTEKYDPVSNSTVQTSLEVVHFDEVSARYVRFYTGKLNPTSWIGLFSIYIYGADADGELTLGETYELPADMTLSTFDSFFLPFQTEYTFQVDPDEEYVLTVDKTLDEQKVFIDGVQTDTRTVRVGDLLNDQQDVFISVHSADGNHQIDYRISLVTHPLNDNRFNLAWTDEFEGEQLDESKWTYRTGAKAFTHNGETIASLNRPENISVRDGAMRIALKKETITEGGTTSDYTSGGIISKVGFGFGYYETRVKLFNKDGFHSSFWTMGSNGIPAVSEIDGFEVNSNTPPSIINTNAHKYGPGVINGKGAGHKAFEVVDDYGADYNTYGFEYTPDKLYWYVNGELLREETFNGPHLPQNILLTSLANTFPIDDSALPGEVSFDYFKYYHKDYEGLDIPSGAIVVDQNDPSYSEIGNWTVSEQAFAHDVTELFNERQGVSDATYFAGYGYGAEGYKKTSKMSANLGDSVTWTPTIEEAGTYEVAVWNPMSWENTNTNAKYTVTSANGVRDVHIDQSKIGQKWVSLGQYTFDAGNDGHVQLSVTEKLNTRADAAFFVKVPDTPAGLSVTELSNHAFELTWDEVPGATSYRIYSSTDHDMFFDLIEEVSEQTSVVIEGLDLDRVHSFKMSALNGGVESALSQQVTFTTGSELAALQLLVESFEKNGSFANEQAVRALTIHLSAVQVFEQQKNAMKVVQHMEGFLLLLEHQRNQAWISEQTYHTLKAETEALIGKWQ